MTMVFSGCLMYLWLLKSRRGVSTLPQLAFTQSLDLLHHTALWEDIDKSYLLPLLLAW